MPSPNIISLDTITISNWHCAIKIGNKQQQQQKSTRKYTKNTENIEKAIGA